MLEAGSGHEAEAGAVGAAGVVDGERGSDCLYDILPNIQAKQPTSKILSQLKEGIGPSWVREG